CPPSNPSRAPPASLQLGSPTQSRHSTSTSDPARRRRWPTRWSWTIEARARRPTADGPAPRAPLRVAGGRELAGHYGIGPFHGGPEEGRSRGSAAGHRGL